MKISTFSLIIFLVLLSIGNSFAGSTDTGNERTYTEQDWGLGASMRVGAIPFATEERTVASFVPLMFYHGKYFYMDGIEGGFKLYDTDKWQFRAMGRLRFFDVPAEYQNQIQGNNVLWGIKARFKPIRFTYTDLELLSDVYGHFISELRLGLDYKTRRFRGELYGEFQFKTSSFNSYYYGLDQTDVGGGTEIAAGLMINYHVLSNLYLFGTGKLSFLDHNVRNLDIINRDLYWQAYLGFGFSNDWDKKKKSVLKSKSYVRLAMGWATPSDLSKIIRFNAVPDSANNHMTSIFYGHPLTDNLFGLPLNFYLHTGFVWHWSNQPYQGNAQEAVLAIKFYYTIPWPIRWKFGAAEGFSYVNKIPFVEKTEMIRKGYKPSNLLNFLDFSLDFNIGDIFGGKQLKKLWIGYGIHHRSAIFEKSQQFGRIKGGSNFQTAYLMWDF